MTTFCIVRHGKNLRNELHRYQGHSDSPLTKQGVALADQLHEGLAAIPFALAATSTSETAMDTLQHIVKGRNILTRYEKNLKEVFFGNKEGAIIEFAMPPKEIDAIGYRFCGGENREEAGLQFQNCLKEIAVEGNVLVVTHAAVIFSLLQYIDSLILYGETNLLISDCSVTKIGYEHYTFHIEEMPSKKYLREDTTC